MSELFKSNIKDWVIIDNEIKKLNEQIRELRDRKGSKYEDIIEYVNTNELSSATIQISDGLLKFQNTNQTSPLTFKFIQKCLVDIIKNEEKVDTIINYIKEQREIKSTIDIKRIYK